MRIMVGIDNNFEGKSLAWALDFPGCFAYGADGSESILNIPQALLRYKEWVDSHLADSWMKNLQNFNIHLEENYEVFSANEEFDLKQGGSEVNTWLHHDSKPLTAEEIRRGTLILQWSRADLLELVAGLSPAQMMSKFEGERWSISGVLRHVADGEHWYLERLDMADCAIHDLPEDIFERLLKVRQRLNQVLPSLEGVQKVVRLDGEFWSPRKLLRRAAWHEIDHIDHIFKLISQL